MLESLKKVLCNDRFGRADEENVVFFELLVAESDVVSVRSNETCDLDRFEILKFKLVAVEVYFEIFRPEVTFFS